MTSRYALVTGATSGIGRAFASELAQQGWAVVGVARDEIRLRELAEKLPGGSHQYLPADLSTQEGRDLVARRVEQDGDAISLLVNAAGMGTSAPFPEASLDEERMMLRVNVEAVLELSYCAARAMKARGSGGIINVSSTAAYWSVGTYSASKAWVLAETLGLAYQMADSAVRVMVTVPGFTRTEFHLRSSTDASGVQPWLWIEADQVVQDSLRDLDRGRMICIPGSRYRLLVELVRHLPPGGRRWVLRRLAPLRGVGD